MGFSPSLSTPRDPPGRMRMEYDADVRQPKEALFHYIEVFYNQQRRHSRWTRSVRPRTKRLHEQ
jgi:hypothetical protein